MAAGRWEFVLFEKLKGILNSPLHLTSSVIPPCFLGTDPSSQGGVLSSLFMNMMEKNSPLFPHPPGSGFAPGEQTPSSAFQNIF